jgi:DeoR/GlpR family transcriptional regulator of sugar metabolism
VLASSEKFGAASPFRVVEFTDVTAALTDSSDEQAIGALRQAGLPVIAAAPEEICADASRSALPRTE